MLDILTACLAHCVHCLCDQTLNTLLTCCTALCVLAVYTLYLLHYFVCIIHLLRYAMCANYQLHIVHTLICQIILCVLVVYMSYQLHYSVSTCSICPWPSALQCMYLQNMLITICILLCILVVYTPYHLPYTLKGHLTESVTGHRVDLQSPWQAGSQQVTRLKVRLDCYFRTWTPHFRPHGLLWPSSLGMTPVQYRAWFRFWFCDLPWPASRLLLTNGPRHWRNDHHLKRLFATPFRSLPPKCQSTDKWKQDHSGCNPSATRKTANRQQFQRLCSADNNEDWHGGSSANVKPRMNG